MPRIPYIQLDTLAEPVRDAVAAFEKEHGHSNLRRLLAHYPPALIALDHMYHPFVTTGELSRKTKELIIVAASSVRGDTYSTTVHTRFLGKELQVDPTTLDNVVHGRLSPALSEQDQALVNFARRAAADPRQLEDNDFLRLEQVGLTPSTIMEALAIIMLSAFTNTMAIALQLPLPTDDE